MAQNATHTHDRGSPRQANGQNRQTGKQARKESLLCAYILCMHGAVLEGEVGLGNHNNHNNHNNSSPSLGYITRWQASECIISYGRFRTVYCNHTVNTVLTLSTLPTNQPTRGGSGEAGVFSAFHHLFLACSNRRETKNPSEPTIPIGQATSLPGPIKVFSGDGIQRIIS